MHGYEMLQTLVERHADRIVKVRPGSLYHVVDRLTEEKLIRRAATDSGGKRPERVIYEITDAGAEALAERVRELIARPVHEFPQFVVALAEIDTLGKTPRRTRSTSASGRWRPGPPRPWHFATPVLCLPRIWWPWTTCWRPCKTSSPGCGALPTRCGPVSSGGGRRGRQQSGARDEVGR